MIQHSRDLSDRICEQLAAGWTLRSVCNDADMPSRQAVQKWIAGNVDDFATRYAGARQFGYATMEAWAHDNKHRCVPCRQFPPNASGRVGSQVSRVRARVRRAGCAK